MSYRKSDSKEGEQAYVLVNDFGTIIRRDVQVGQENGDKMAIESGLESADRVVISSKPVKSVILLNQMQRLLLMNQQPTNQ